MTCFKVLLLLLFEVCTFVSGQLTVSLLDTAVMVKEGEQFGLKVKKSGPVTEVINVIVAVKSPIDNDKDFVGSSQVGSFYPGGPDVIAVTFTVNDDSKPETEETFTFELTVISAGVTVVAPRVAAVTIAANDDAYGVFSFLDTSPVLVTEDTITTVVNLRVGREKGTFGQVTVTYLINSTDAAAVPGQDISPRTGVLVFQEGETQNYLQLQIRADNTPENNEEFKVTLTSATVGARVTDTEMLLIIQANDAPVRFQQSEYRFDEGPNDKSVAIQVLRGIDEDGQSRIGSVNAIASVDYFLLSDTATSGLDFRGSNGQVVFFAGETTKNIRIEIIDDSDPEMEETFGLILSGPKGDIITTYPTKINVRINANDNPNGVLSFMSTNSVLPPEVRKNEDTGSAVEFIVQRQAGTFGTVSVRWEVFRNDSALGDIKNDISVTAGTVIFLAGQTQQKINISIINDNIPEPTERYIVKLMPGTETGGVKVEGIVEGVLFIEDSDNYYGMVQLGPDSEQKIVVSPIPRRLHIDVRRTGNNQADLLVNLTVTYTGTGSVNDVLENPSMQTEIKSGQSSKVVEFPLMTAAFLQVGDEFSVILTNVRLITDPEFGAYNSPSLGSKVTANVPVTLSVANGEIGFQSVQTVMVDEPQNTPYTVILKLTREGTSGRATINWSLKGTGSSAAMVTTGDTGMTSGSVIMEAGRSEASLVVTIMPDTVPEVDEELTVTLNSVSPADTQRLKTGSTQVKVVITENDSPGGVFQFSTVMNTSYIVKEGQSGIEVVVERKGGDLITQFVQYNIEPSGNQEFYGATNVLKFDPGVRFRNSTLLAIADGIPELKESYTLTLSSYSNLSSSIGGFNEISIEVEENDDPYGLVRFQLNPARYYLNESENGAKTSITIPIERARGRYGNLLVAWKMDPSNGVDLIPVGGTITFGAKQDQGFIHLESASDDVSHLDLQTINDDIPEKDENFTITLTISSGKGRIGSPEKAVVTILENDHRLYFRGRFRRRFRRTAVLSGAQFVFENVVYTKEPGMVKLYLKRDGPGTERATMRYQTVDSSATASSGDYRQILAQELVFEVGEMQREINVEILNDDIAEGNETFYLQIFDIKGDLVMTDGPNATIVILANDDAYGVFRFLPPVEVSAEEGSTVSFNIYRDRGRFGVVDVAWDIRDAITNQLMHDGGEFGKANGTVQFMEFELTKVLYVTPRVDRVPEQDKQFKVSLTYVIIREGIADDTLASISNINNQAKLTVKASDDPMGRFAFTSATKSQNIAEDYYPGAEESARAVFTVERRQGIYGNVEVLWEVFSSKVGGNLPKIYDLIFLANIPQKTSRVPSKRRPNTGTDVIFLTGAQSDFLTVETKDHPVSTEIQNGFSISAWVQPITSGSFYVLAKTTSDGSRLFYSLKIVAGDSTSILLFGFSQMGTNNNQEIFVSTSKLLRDSKWHHVFVAIGAGQVSFYLDGQLIGTKFIGSQGLIDLAGVLLVGARAPNKEQYIGYLQDVRIFTAKLSLSDIQEVYNTPSQSDLTPISGQLVFVEGQTAQNLTLTTVQDVEEENDEMFSVVLIGASRGGVVSQADGKATLTVLKSDSANGVFGFLGDCTPTHSTKENELITCTVRRNRGDDGSVNVTWSVFRTGSNIEATEDFVNSSGVISFLPGDRNKMFTLTVIDDDIPESQETFDIRLTAALTGTIGSTNTSGASIDLSASVSKFVILKSDNSNGLLQFFNSSVPPKPDIGIIPPATQKAQIHVAEESGMISLVVVRAQGTEGQVTVEWRTADITALSSGKTPTDYQSSAGRLTFGDGVLYRLISIMINDNNVPEDKKMFSVNLYNPTGGAVLGVASAITVIINHSDGAYGVFEFDDKSLNVQAMELGDSGSTSTPLKILRKQGNIGTVAVKWKLQGNPGNNVVHSEGTVTFQHGDLESLLYINVRGDTLPELDKTYQVILVNATPGTIGDKKESNFTILASDNPYGVFEIHNDFRPIQVDEQYKNVSVTISRQFGAFGVVEVFYKTLKPTEFYSYLPRPPARADINDYRHVEGSVRFMSGQEKATFNVLIMDDNSPETDESVFVILYKLQTLSQAQDRMLTDSPILGQASKTYAQIIIRSNDNAHGSLILSPASSNTLENATDVGMNVVRQGGTFGEVSITFRVVNNTALQNLDFQLLSNIVRLPEGVTSVPLPIKLIDDLIPELNEVFYVELQNQISGGAVLGTPYYGVINILPSDNPYGLFEFPASGLTVEEPENGVPLSVNITVIRRGGTVDVVTLQWQASLNGKPASSDINPTSGTISFVSNEASRQILLSILPDDIPEGQEDITVTLLKASNGGNIGSKRDFTLSIAPNDNPHGTVQFSTENYTVTEMQGNSVQYLSLTRQGGSYGQLRVYFSTIQAGFSTGNVLSYYDPPRSGSRGISGQVYSPTSSTDPIMACADNCLQISSCLAFEFSSVDNITLCMWFTTPASSPLIPKANYQYYSKNVVKVQEARNNMATGGQDYSVVTNGYIMLNDGATHGLLPVNILADTIPELEEIFYIQLTRMEVASSTASVKYPPQIGELGRAVVSIVKNDNAFGKFRLISASPLATDGGQTIAVEEKPQLAVDLVVERLGGNLGDVSVDWYVNRSLSSAEYGKDFLADGATLNFNPGLTKRGITITILDDSLPEENKTIVVQLRNPAGGAEIEDNDGVSVIVMENDNVAGVFGFETTALLAQEGDKIKLNVIRTKSSKGTVSVGWEIQGMNGLKPQDGFVIHQGTFTFLPGVISKVINLEVKSDNKPETNEEYQIKLVNLTTTGIGQSGSATVDPLLQKAVITIKGSNDPHGVIQFSQASLNVRTEEENKVLDLQVDRKFGAIGTVRVSYEISQGSISKLSDELVAATANNDFVPVQGYIDMPDDNVSMTIRVQIKDDTVPEVDEVFIVSLTGVTLVNSSDESSMPPKLASSGTVSQIIINANDGTKGVVRFGSDSHTVTVDEITKNISLSVVRGQGTFGNVSVFYYAQSIVKGTTQGLDFNIEPQRINFANGERQKYIMLEIVDDNIPEPDETFQVILSNPLGGLAVGEPSKANVTILANDGSSGSVKFETDALVKIDETAEPNTESNKAKLRIVRGPGIYGIVNVPYKVVPEKAENIGDLSATQGTVTFQNLQDVVVLELTALDDAIPEHDELFTIQLLDPDNSAKLGAVTQKNVVIKANDSPNGLLQINVRHTNNDTISVEENIGQIYFDVTRTQGTDGTVTVDIATEPGTAVVNTDLKLVTLSPLEKVITSQVTGWYSFTMNGTLYLVMLTSYRVGELKTAIGSDGRDLPVNVDRLLYSTLFKWQGQLVPVQTIETDVASAAESFTIDRVTYLVVSNHGNVRRYQTKSRLYRVNTDSSLLVLQDFITLGASDVQYFASKTDHFLVFTNSKNNNGETLVNVDIYKWDSSTSLFIPSQWQSLSNQGASGVAIFQIEAVTYMAVANNYNSQLKSFVVHSIIYKLGSDQKFSEHQRIQTNGAVDVSFLEINSLNLLIFANNRGDVVSSPQTSLVYRWDSTSQSFFRHTDIKTNRVNSIASFIGTDSTGYLTVSNNIGKSSIYAWDIQKQKFDSVWTGPPSRELRPVTVVQESGSFTMIPMVDVDSKANCTLFHFMKVKDTDFSPRTITMTFGSGQKTRSTSVSILQDDFPEDTETFYVAIRNPTGGANIGPKNKITINILSNDNAHGIVEIAEDSRGKTVQEVDNKDNKIYVNVVRHHGFIGRVVVSWSASGDQSGLKDITPLSGQVEFPNGQPTAVITLTVLNDNLAELPEVTFIRLLKVIESGTDLEGKGAQIGPNNVARIIVQANDSPYGVVLWERQSLIVNEPNGTDSLHAVYIVREQGMLGDLQISYQTNRDPSKQPSGQAVSGLDYVAKQAIVIMQENTTRVSAEIVIKPDELPEAAESFLVNITSVIVRGVTPPAGAEPSVKVPGNILTITVRENDGIRGMVQFNVTTNIEGRVDVYEEYGKNTTVKLKVSRSIGNLGDVILSWQAEPNEATTQDFYPSVGSIHLKDGQDNAEIIINIIDDTIAENMETFNVRLLGITSGGSVLGSKDSVRVAILKNDSPNGLFRFTQSTVNVRESRSANDQQGEVTLTVERIQGTDGVVNVQWRLNAEAFFDFMEPRSGTLLFAEGQSTKRITLRTKPDSILEGEEQFRVSLISADNNADISHTQGDATIVVQADPGARGTISILPEYRKVYIGEPGESSPSYDGQVQIKITRGLGIYGSIAVTWSLTPRETSAFLQVEGLVSLADLQQTAFITLQSIDDTLPENRTVYDFHITSATGGATVSTDTTANMANVIFVASDHPHGLFQFTLPQIQSVMEDSDKVNIPIIRTAGSEYPVLVSYTTTPGTAQSYSDFYPSVSTVEFQQGDIRKMIEIRIIQDDEPEGPEMFYVNLTSVRLLTPGKNNYTIVNGLQLDMKPAIGPISVKTILINKNDNAEGTVEFDSSAANFRVSEESGLAQIPLIRTGGNYGDVTIMYSTLNITATPDVDYVISQNQVSMLNGRRNVTIDITIRDDSEMEFDETFEIHLLSVSGGALLGQRNKSIVTIVKSDYPNGNFGFKGQLEFKFANPERQIKQSFTIERKGGLQGQQKVLWRIMGPNNPLQVLEATNDISHVADNKEVTSGSLTWNNGETGDKSFILDIKPFTSWEIQKTFVIEIHQIHGSPSGVGDGEISITTGKSTVTIEKFGDPNGIVRFQGLAQTERLVDEPEGITPLQLQFPISRREGTGTTGSIQIKWSVDGPYHVKFPDFQPQNGSIVMGDGQRDSVIVLQVLPDSVPELTESFKLVLKSVIGGAEIDTQFNTSSFKIKYNNHPHGLFGVQQRTQSLYVDPADLNRYVRINITRYFGLFGSVYVTYNIKYDQPLSGIIPSRSSGGVQFNDSVPTVTTDVLIGGDGFLELDSTFTITLTQVQFLGAGVTEPPKFKTGETEVKVRVPAFAANSEVGFQDTLASIDEVTGTSVITLTRIGQYGTISVPWKKGFPSTLKPQNFEEGQINPASGSVTIQHGVKTKNFTVSTPSTAARGGARLSVTKSLVKLEPHGIIRFAPNSTNPSVSEMDSTISLLVQRVYGSEGKIEIGYRSVEISATKLLDFTTTETNALILNPGVTSGLITLQVIQDNMPEEEEFFSVNLTHVEKYPTEIVPKISPRLSYISANSLVRIKESNDAYGVLCLEPTSVVIQEEFRKVNLTIRRTGGLYGSVSVIVRSVGGGETWTSQIVPDENPNTNDTIRQILGSRSSTNVAIGGQDYELVNTKVTFKQSEQVKFVSVTVLSDETAEPDESIIIYLTQPTGGARIAKGAPDGGKKGYAVITIEQNDLSNGIIGFSTGSKALTVNEDSSPVITLTLTRTNAYYDKVTVVWIAKWSENSTTAQDSVLAQELETTAGEFSCPATPRCSFDVRLKNDSRPEEEQHFIIKLLKVYRDAQLDIYSTTANITVEPSDYVRGLIQFTNMSRVTVIGKNERNVRLWVERIKGNGYNVTVGFQTDMMTSQESVYGITINPALENQDYMRNTGTLIFLKHRQEIKFIDINMTPINADKNPNPLPRQFYVILKNPSNGASIHPDISHSRAIIRIVEDADVSIWKEVHKNIGSLNNDENILSTLSTLDKIAKTYLDETEMALMESILKNIIEEGLKRELSDDILNQLLNVLCNLMNPNKADATRGRNSLSVLMESLAYAMLTGKPCPSPSYPRLKEFQCAHAKISGGRWPLQQIQGFQYNAQRKDTFKIPSVIMNPPTPVQSNCSDFHMTEYSSEQWFMTTNEKQLLSSKILAFGIKGKRSAYNEDPARFVIHTPDRRIAAKYAQVQDFIHSQGDKNTEWIIILSKTKEKRCVYFDFSTKSWDPSGHCTVNNNLELAQDDYVDCSCRHLTHYAVKGFGESLTGYPTAFYVASFICMIALILAILVHHVYSTVHAMFSASLLMHMIFACFATQLCYVVAAYTSPSEVLVTSLDQDNYRCIVMGLFLHYFFLTQFTWIFSQTINFWKILVMNDEHTDTKYVIFFLIGWGSPLVILAIFYAVTYNLYKYVYNMPVNFIYGDVNNNGQMCFITNGYAALGGVIAPVIFILLFVAVVFVRAFQVTPQWQAYDDIYRGRYNINEVRTLLSFWFIVALTWLWGGLHLAFGQLWMLVMYCIFNILEGLLVIVLYTILRNPCIQQCFGPQKKAYSMSTENLHENGSLPVDFHHTFTTEIASLKGSTASVVNEEWERDDSTMPSKSTTMKVKRTLPSSGNIYVTPPVLERPLNEGEDFHDFLHALKNQESSSDVESLVSEKMSDVSSNVDRYEMRRISIADTHL